MTDLSVGMIKGFGVRHSHHADLLPSGVGRQGWRGGRGQWHDPRRGHLLLSLLIFNFFLSLLLNYFFPIGGDA